MNSVRNFISALIIVTAVLFQASAAEGAKPRLTLKTTAEKEVVKMSGGREIIETVPAKDTKSGDVILYTINYKNEGQVEAKDAFVIDPIPQGACYLEGSATTEGVSLSFSLDSGNTFLSPPVKIKRKKADGTSEEVPAPPASYTHIRWGFPKALLPGQSGTLFFRVKVY